MDTHQFDYNRKRKKTIRYFVLSFLTLIGPTRRVILFIDFFASECSVNLGQDLLIGEVF